MLFSTHLNRLFLPVLAVLCGAAHAAGKAPAIIEGTRSDPKEIAAILESIPATTPEDSTLADRLLRLNLDVKFVMVSRFTAEDVQQSGGILRRGDVNYLFTTTEPNDRVKAQCPIWSTFAFTRRGHIWLPKTKSANFLANVPCIARHLDPLERRWNRFNSTNLLQLSRRCW